MFLLHGKNYYLIITYEEIHMKKTTISDIAKKADISVTAVSLVLSNRPNRISKKTKQKIYDAVKELNYIPNSYAQGLVTQKSKVIGLIIPDIENAYFASISKAASEYAEKNGYIVLLLNSNDSHKLNLSQIRTLIQRNVDGFLLVMPNESYYPENEKELKEVLSKIHLPYVLIDRVYSGFNSNKVYFDNVEGGYLATKHLIDSGHRRIACITGPKKTYSSIERFMGYQKALEENHIKTDFSIVVEGDYHLISGKDGMNILLKQNFDAVFCFNDLMAYGAIIALHDNNKSIPEDCSIIGYDNYTSITMTETYLDSIDQDSHALAKEGAKMLLNCIEHTDAEPTEIKLKPTLVVRKSTSVI